MELTENNGFILINVKVVPKSSKNALEYYNKGIKVKLKSPPVDGKANKELVEYLAKVLGIAKNRIQIEHGETSKTKTIRIEITALEFINIIGGICG